MLNTFIRSRLGQALVNRLLACAMRTPYRHLFHDDGRPYMARYWLLRIGKTRSDESGDSYPWFGIRIHHIMSSDDRVFHDHPWTFATLILRGGYTEVTPLRPGESLIKRRRYFGAGSLRLVRAKQWHFLEVDDNADAWTMFVTFRKVQDWGFLVNGVKVPWRRYLAQRAAAKSEGVSA